MEIKFNNKQDTINNNDDNKERKSFSSNKKSSRVKFMEIMHDS